MRLAVVGGGEGARKALTALCGWPPLDVAAVVCRASEWTDLGVDSTRLDRWQPLLEREDVDAVYVATPPDAHVEIAEAALRAGKHVLVEKPVARSAAEARRLMQVSRGANGALVVAFKKRYGDGIAAIHELIERHGPVLELAYHWHTPRPTSPWRFDAARSGGGIVMDLGSHVIDLFEHAFGDVQEVRSVVLERPRADSVEEAAEIALALSDDIRAGISLRWCGDQKRQELCVRGAGFEATLRRMSEARDVLRVTGAEESAAQRDLESRQEYVHLFEALHDAVAGETASLPGIDAGLRNLELIERILDRGAHPPVIRCI